MVEFRGVAPQSFKRQSSLDQGHYTRAKWEPIVYPWAIGCVVGFLAYAGVVIYVLWRC